MLNQFVTFYKLDLFDLLLGVKLRSENNELKMINGLDIIDGRNNEHTKLR